MSNIPCNKCDAKCCKNYDVFVDIDDIKNFPDPSNYKIIEYDKSFGNIPNFNLWINGIKKKSVICLNNPKKVCKFLKEDKCSIYEDRPLICRIYPHFLNNTMEDICPVKWVLNSDQKKEINKNYDKLLVNFLSLETICDEWNKIVSKKDNLNNFIIFVLNYNFKKLIL